MLRTRTAIVTLAALLLAQAAQAAPPLPRYATSDQVMVVAYVDVEKIDIPTLQATAKAVLGDDPGPAGAALLLVAGMREKFVAAGGRSLVLLGVAARGENAPDDATIFVGLRDGAAPDDMRRFLAGLQGNQPAFAVNDADKGWLRLNPSHRQARPLPAVNEGAGGEHQKLLQDALQEAGDAPLALLFVPTEILRGFIPPPRPDEMPPGFPDGPGLARQIVAVQWAAITAKVGADPVLKAVAQTPTAEAAKALADKWNGVLNETAAFLKTPPPEVHMGPTERTMAGAVVGLMAIPAKAAGRQVSLTLTKADMQKVAKDLVGGLMGARGDARNAASMNNLRQLAIGVINYASDHKGELPDNLDQIKKYIGNNDEAFARILTNPRTGENPGYVYTKPAAKLADVKQPGSTAILHEAKDGKADPNGAVGYLDGHVVAPGVATRPAPKW